ncbi:hypothetical protein [Mariniflexile sp.]|uniref:hypothetical protein n=1 Tax=Mariniflexile sp. TaxID=1979402 RepID=UPI004048817E
MKYIIIYIYIAINVFLLILNWNLFSTSINIDLGFGVFYMPPLILVQVIGLAAIILFAIHDGVKDLKRERIISDLQNTITSLEKDSIINNLKDALHSKTESNNDKIIKAEIIE